MRFARRRNWTHPTKTPHAPPLQPGRRLLRAASLFAGVGGFDLGLCSIMETSLYVERDEACVTVLEKLQNTGHLPRGKIVRDVRAVTQVDLRGIDMLVGGFPCPDIAVAGARLGFQGERSVLFHAFVEAAIRSQAPFVFVENVAAIVGKGMEDVFKEVVQLLAAAGYVNLRWCVIRAEHVGSPQCRKRWFLLGWRTAANLERLQHLVAGMDHAESQAMARAPWNATAKVAYEDMLLQKKPPDAFERMRQMGNCVVPQCALLAFRLLVHGT